MDPAFVFLIGALIAFLVGGCAGFVLGIGRGVAIGMRVNERPPTPLLWMGCLAFASLFFLGALAATVHSVVFLKHSFATTGTVMELAESKDKDGNRHATPVYQFTDARGAVFKGRSDFSSSDDPVIGQTVAIRYLPDKPQSSRLDRFGDHWFLSILLGSFALVLAIVGLGLRWRQRQPPRPSPLPGQKNVAG